MEAGDCTEKRTYSWDLVKPMSSDMDDHGALPIPRSAGLRVSAKSKAPSPPGLKTLASSDLSQWYPGGPHLTMDQQEKPIDQDLSLAVVLPDGEERMTTVHGRKPVMDLLVTLCAQYHLNPSSYTLELVTANRKNTKLKPNALIGTLDVEKILLKPKGEDKNKKPGPQMPEATVRMVINYKKTQKTILRVSPRVPLADHLPAICEKCEFDVESTVLLRDVHSLSALDLSCSLNDYAIREVYARDTKRQSASPVSPVSLSHAVFPSKDKTQKEEENKGLFSKFRKSRKKSEQETAVSVPGSPVLVSKPRPLSMALPSSNSYPLGSSVVLADGPKKRRAPQPPVVVSQGCSDISPRRRINSEPNTRLELDQVASLSRGSSTESSLKRTKRKAPLPPTTPGAAVQETVPGKENSQGGAAASTLEEIMEQEEANVLLSSAAATDSQEEQRDLSKAADVPPPSPDTDIPCTASMESNGEDQSQDLSSDNKKLQKTEDESASPNGVRTEDAGASETADITSTPCHLENGIQEAMSEESEGVKDDSSAATCILSPPVMQDAEVQYSFETNTEIPCKRTDKTPVMSDTSCPSEEISQMEIDVAALPPPPPEIVEEASSLANIPALETAEKKDMATSTEELDTPDLKGATSRASETLPCQDPTPGAADEAMAPCSYATNSEPKPKPSNELTRDYIPKVGMTTYTIVPQKSLEKLRYFEVALTLERPSATVEKELDIGSLSVEDSTTPREQPEVSKERGDRQSISRREDFLKSTTTATTDDTVNGSVPGSVRSSSSAVDGVQPASPTQVKQVKVPPATRPKPASFRLTQHKKTPGYYVTSAAEKSLISSSASGLKGAPERAQLPSPPPLLPGKSLDETSGAHNAELSPREDKMAKITRQSSLPVKPLSTGMSLEKLRSFAAPKPFCPTTPSRFAQAVSSAVKRSQSLAHSPKSPCSPHSAPRSPSTSSPSVGENKEFTEFKDNESTEMDGDKSCPLVVEAEGPVVMGGESP